MRDKNNFLLSTSSFKVNAITIYFVIAFLFTWAFHIAIPVLGFDFSASLSNPGLLLYFIGLLGPLISSIYVTRRKEGWKAVKKLLKKGLKWKFSWKWYVFAMFSVPTLMLLNLAIDRVEAPFETSNFSFVLLPLIAQIWVVLGEEYGWRGFALPRLQNQYGSIGASILLGFLWAFWHFPMFFIPGSAQYTDAIVEDFSNYVLLLIFWSIIMTMLYYRTKRSLLVCFIFHAFVNFGAWIIAVPEGNDYLLYLYIPLVLFSIFLMPRPFFKKPTGLIQTKNGG